MSECKRHPGLASKNIDKNSCQNDSKRMKHWDQEITSEQLEIGMCGTVSLSHAGGKIDLSCIFGQQCWTWMNLQYIYIYLHKSYVL